MRTLITRLGAVATLSLALGVIAAPAANAGSPKRSHDAAVSVTAPSSTTSFGDWSAQRWAGQRWANEDWAAQRWVGQRWAGSGWGF
jgi:hypothetical protein